MAPDFTHWSGSTVDFCYFKTMPGELLPELPQTFTRTTPNSYQNYPKKHLRLGRLQLWARMSFRRPSGMVLGVSRSNNLFSVIPRFLTHTH
jgi:hypothetical protein